MTVQQKVALENLKKYVESAFFRFSAYCILDAGQVFDMFREFSITKALLPPQ